MASSAENLDKTYPIDLFVKPSAKDEKSLRFTKDALERLKKGQKRRVDGRALDEFRPISITSDAAQSADGSAYAELGKTKVYCVVNGPHEINKADIVSESPWRALISVKVTYSPFAFRSRLKRARSDQETTEERTYASIITDAFSSVIILDRYPRSQIDLQITVIEDDGGALPLAMTACSVALTNAGIEIYDVVVAATLVAVEDQFMVDPTLDERGQASAAPSTPESGNSVSESGHITFGLMPSLNQVVCMNQDGQLRPKNFGQAIKIISDCCYRLYPVVQAAISKSIRRERRIASAQKAKDK